MIAYIQNKIRQQPKGLGILLCTEIPELFGRFSITALLVLYLTRTLYFGDAKAFAMYSMFIALIYVTPILGGIIADKLLGNKKSIIFGGLLMTLGNFFLVFPSTDMVCLWSGYYCSR